MRRCNPPFDFNIPKERFYVISSKRHLFVVYNSKKSTSLSFFCFLNLNLVPAKHNAHFVTLAYNFVKKRFNSGINIVNMVN